MAKSFQTEFVDYYKDKLAAKGFVKVKGRQPYFVRVVNDEILHVITYLNRPSTEIKFKKAFELACGVATVYKKEIDFSVSPTKNDDWLVYQTDIEKKKETWHTDIRMKGILRTIYYNDDIIPETLQKTEEGMDVLLEVLDKVINMEEVAKYFMKYDVKNFRFNHLTDDGWYDQECLYYCRKEYDFSIMSDIAKFMIEDFKNPHICVFYDEFEIEKWEQNIINKRNMFINNEIDYEIGMELLKKHYEHNLETLHNYGIEISRHDFL